MPQAQCFIGGLTRGEAIMKPQKQSTSSDKAVLT
jgi:hypothetical protein